MPCRRAAEHWSPFQVRAMQLPGQGGRDGRLRAISSERCRSAGGLLHLAIRSLLCARILDWTDEVEQSCASIGNALLVGHVRRLFTPALSKSTDVASVDAAVNDFK